MVLLIPRRAREMVASHGFQSWLVTRDNLHHLNKTSNMNIKRSVEEEPDQEEATAKRQKTDNVSWFVETPHFDTDIDKDGCRIMYSRNFLSADGVARIRKLLDGIDEKDWFTGSCYGYPIPRLIRWYGAASYRFGGQDWPPCDYPDQLLDLQEQLQLHVRTHADPDASFGSCLVNKYRHGKDSISKHSDGEKEFGVNPSIASLSVGVTRVFYMQRKNDPSSPKLAFPLGEGSFVYMSGRTQELYVHWIEKEPKVQGIRYNLTFRPYFDSTM
jgi:alkylated DNA repair dioxygenase AlkB